MYKMIGGDGREYGPVSAEQLRQWAAEGRANANTRVLDEATTEWKPLGAVPELSGQATPPPPPPLPSPSAVSPPATEPKSKIAAGLLGIFLGGFGIHRFYLGYTAIGIAQLIVNIVTCGIVGSLWGFVEGLLILTGAINKDADGVLLRD
jgi:TM2 domain-containing membrane protein YozV